MKKGFTLIEMMIVVAIIAIIAAIAIPSLLAARRNSLETNAVGSCRACASAQTMFHRNDWDADGVLSYAADYSVLYSQLDGNNNPIALIDAAFAAAKASGAATPKHGYIFDDMTSVDGTAMDPVDDYGLCGLPSTYGRTGYRTFIVSTNGTVFGRDQGSAGAIVTDYPADPTTSSWIIAE